MNSSTETGPEEIAARLARAHAAATHPDTSIPPDSSPFIGAEASPEDLDRDTPESGMVSYTQLLGGAALENP